MFPVNTYKKSSANPILKFDIDSSVLSLLEQKPFDTIRSQMDGVEFDIKIVIPNYISKMTSFYQSQLKHDPSYYHEKLKLARPFAHFGIAIAFTEPVELHLHGTEMALPQSVKSLIRDYGVLILRNACLDSSVRDMGHRNRFPQLNFHIDRKPEQISFYSTYTRNPFDEEQRHPRTSSTLFIPPLAAYLQASLEKKPVAISDTGLIVNVTLFDAETIKPALNRIIVEHAWNEPEGTGEISIIDNCTMLHASYYPDIHNKGYRIGVRYLS